MNENTATAMEIVVFTIDELPYAISLSAVVKVIEAIEIRKLPNAPEIITGIINVKGTIIPVVDIRKRLGLAASEIGLDNQLIIAETGKRRVAIMVDAVKGINKIEYTLEEASNKALSLAKHIKGVAKVDDGLVLIYNLDHFLSIDEEVELEVALKTKSQ